jgi:putative transposase
MGWYWLRQQRPMVRLNGSSTHPLRFYLLQVSIRFCIVIPLAAVFTFSQSRLLKPEYRLSLRFITMPSSGIVRLSVITAIRQFARHTSPMQTSISLYHRHRFPAEIISHCVWLYFRFALSFRDVEEMLAMRGVTVSYETIPEWCLKFGQTYANDLRRRSPRPGDKWHLDEVFLKINGRTHYLFRAVDQDGDVLDIMVQYKRDKTAAKRFFSKLLKRLRYVPYIIVTDKLRSYGAARTEVMPRVEHLRQFHYSDLGGAKAPP